MRDHTKLKVFHLAEATALLVYEASRDFPSDERFGLTSQVRRAAVSIGANIVEAAARPTRADYARLLAVAYGSARELEYEISLAIRLGFLREPAASKLVDLIQQTGRALRALVVSVREGANKRAN